ncbi:MAG: hypothetical protein RR960_04850, partial [Alistipes sp.]
ERIPFATSRQARGSGIVFSKSLRPLDRLEDRERFLFETSVNLFANKKSRLIPIFLEKDFGKI